MDEEQNDVLAIPLDESCLIVGPPGTGKTVVALRRARAFHDDGVPVELSMFNVNLKEYCSAAFASLSLDDALAITHFQWIIRYYKEFFGTEPPKVGEFEFDYQKILNDFLRTLPDVNNGRALILDEGQDIHPDFYILIAFLIGNMQMNSAITADENQAIKTDTSTINEIMTNTGLGEPHYLTTNYRNTREIAKLADNCYTGDGGRPELPDRVGPKPELVPTKSLKEAAEIICRWAENPSHVADTAGVFLFTTRTLKRLETAIRKLKPINSGNPVKIQSAHSGMRRNDPNRIDWGAPGIKLLTYQGSRDTEFDAVFMPELQGIYGPMANPSLKETKQRFYVAISRARTELTLMYSGEGEPELLALFPKDLIDEGDDLLI